MDCIKIAKIMSFYLIIVIQTIATAPCYADQPGLAIIEKYASEACATLEKMIGSKKEDPRTVFIPFTGYKSVTDARLNKYDASGNSDERYFEDCLFQRFVISNSFKVFTRNKLDKALKEMKLQMTDLFDPDTAKRVGKFIGADVIVLMEGYIGKSGPFSSAYQMCAGDGSFRVKVLAIDVETAEVKGVWKKFIKNPKLSRLRRLVPRIR